MSKLIFKRKQNVAKTAFKKVFAFFIGTILAIGIFSALNGDGYLFLLSHNTETGSMILQVMQTVSKTLGLTSTTTGDETEVGEQGLNTLLIQKMNAGIAKDYLSICYENEQGKLDTKGRDVYFSAKALVAKNIVESGYTSLKDSSNVIPKTDIPANLIDAGKYGTGNVSLYKWNSKTRSNGATGIGGPFAFTPDNKSWTGLDTKSIYNKSGTSTPNGKGDGWFFPDAVAACNSFAESTFKDIGVSKDLINSNQYGDDIIAFGACVNHNLGPGWYDEMLYGVCYKARGKIGTKNSKETLKRAETIMKDIHSVSDELSDKQLKAIGSDKGAWITDLIMIKAGWKITSTTKNWLLQHKSQTVAAWNTLFPDDKADSGNIESKLSKHVASVASLTGYSTSECDSLFGTSGGNYICPGDASGSHTKYGVLLKVLDGTSKGLKNGNGNTKRVIALNALSVQSAILSVTLANNYVKRMLIYAGVDPKNVTGATTTQSTQTAGNVSFTTKSDVIEALKAHGCDVSKLDKARYSILAAAMQMQGSTYSQSRRCSKSGCANLNHAYYDCSSFTMHAVYAAVKVKLPTTSAYGELSICNNKAYASMKDTDLYPADIFDTKVRGHVMIYVGKKGGYYYVLEANEPSKPNGFHQKTRLTSKVYYVYRLKGQYVVDHF